MGFDNECILNIQSLAGEYFCPVCRLLVYPNEALQSQCTHLYCKPCLTYVVGTTKACPYDGYLVTEADSKPLVESNKTLAETIGKIAVHCLYHRSGCTWQGELSECVTHCAGCAFGNSPVVCNRCGTQIVHRQVQEHAQNCPGVQPQAQLADGSQVTTTATAVTATSGQSQITIQAGAPASQAQVTQIAVAPTSGQGQSQANTNSQPQGVVQAAPTPEQLYQQQQQQYQQYYQQYPGYDPYQQQYQQYASHQQQAYPQYQQQGSMPQAQMYMQPQPQSQTQLPVQPQVQAQAQSQSYPQPQVQLPPQAQTQTQTQPPIHAHPQAQVGVQPQVQPQGTVPNQIQPSHPHPQMQPQPSQLYPQAPSHQQPHPSQLQLQPHIQQRPQVTQHQQTLPQPQQQTHPYPQQQSVAQTQAHPQSQVQPHTHVQVQPQMQPQAQPLTQHQMQPQHPQSHAVTGHQSYPQPPPNQQMPPGASQLQSIHMQPQPQQQGAPHQLPQQTQVPLPQQQLAQMHPTQSHVPMQQQAMVPQNQLPNVPPPQQHVHPHHHQPNQPTHQYSGMHLPLQQNMSQQVVHGQPLHPQAFPGQTPGFVQNTSQQPAPYIQQQPMQPQLRSPVPPLPLPPASHAQQQLQQNVSLSHGFQSQGSQNYGGRPILQNHGVPRQSFQPSPVGQPGPGHAKMQSSGVQQYPPRPNTRPQSTAEQQLGGYMHRPGVSQSGNEAVQVSSSPTPTEHPIMKPKPQDEHVLPTTLSQGSRLTESNGKPENELRPELELKSMGGDNNSVNEGESTGNHSKLGRKESSESSQPLDKNPISSTQEGLDEPVVKNTVKEETIAKSESSVSLAETAVQNKEVIPHITQRQDGHSQPENKKAQDDSKNLSFHLTNSRDGKDGKMVSNPTELQGNLSSHGNINTNEMNGEAHSLPEKNMLQHQSSRQDRVHQVPLISDQMSLQNRHPNQMQVRPPAHMRPQGHNVLGNVPLQGHPLSAPPHFQQPTAKQPRGSLQTEVYPSGIVGPSSFGSGPGPLGPQGHLNIGQMLPHHAGGPRMQGDSVGRPALGGPPPGVFSSQAVTMGRFHPHSQQMPSAPMDSDINANKVPGYYEGRQPDFHMPGPANRVPFAQPSNVHSDAIKMYGGSSRGMSGGSSDPSYPFGLQEERFKHFPEERYRQFPEGFKLPGEEHRSGFSVEQGRRNVNSREFFDDLKQFPRPTHLDAEHGPKSENYFSSSRPFDRAPHGFISDARLKLDTSASDVASRLPPPSQASGLRPIDVRDDIAGRKIHPDFHRSVPESGRLRMDGFPSFRSPGREYSDIPPTRFGRIEDNGGRESHAFGERSKPFNLHSDNNPFPERKFPGLPNLRREEFGVPGNLRIGERLHLMGEDLVGPDILPRHLRSGGPVGSRDLQMGEPGGFGSYPNTLRLGDVGGPGKMPIGGNLPSHSRPGFPRGVPIHGHGSDAGLFNADEMESLDHTRKRKHGSNGWCRICKVDCETVEGLELHSQTREHQKMAMDMVLNIKKDNAKKHKISSDDHMTHEGDTNKTRKAVVENHGN